MNRFEAFEEEWAERPLGDCFSERSRRYPDRVAISLPTGDVTYRELDLQSDRIAAFVDSSTPESTPVLIMMDHETIVPAAILGTAKAGRPFVPLDPSYPEARTNQILEDIGATLCLTDVSSRDAVLSSLGECVVVTVEEIVSGMPSARPARVVSADSLAQIIFTSGSSGRPKGVMRSHRMLVHNAMRHTNARRITRGDRIALLFSYSFGAAMSNVWSSLLNGATLLPFNLRDRGVQRLASWLSVNRITQLHTVPTAFRRLAAFVDEKHSLEDLRLIQLGGESMYKRDLELFKTHFPSGCTLGVGMGTTETGHVLQCFFDLTSDFDEDRLPAGFPADGLEVFVENQEGVRAEPGQVGEILVRGHAIADGYWHQSELTALHFSGASDKSQRTFRTGDMGALREDGAIVHLGRKDDRVKVRGYRVEIGEVEGALRSVDNIEDAAIVASTGLAGETILTAFVVVAKISATAIRAQLRQLLPDYMMPARVVPVDAMPVLPNGKVNRQELQKWALNTEDHGIRPNEGREERRAPRYLLEAQLCALWEESLGIDSVGIDEDYYDLGGDSLHAVDMFVAVEKLTGRSLSPADFLTGLTVAKLCEAVINEDREFFSQPIVAVQPEGSGRPFFFHSGDLETGGLYTRNLARHLSVDRPFYTILGHGIDGQPVPSSVEEMAKDRLRDVLRIQPEGPYQLGGFCFGGLVAFEMAKRLRQRGEQVGPLLLIDTKSRYTTEHVGRIMRVCWRLFPSREIHWYRRLRRPFIYANRAAEMGIKASLEKLIAKGRGLVSGSVVLPSSRPKPRSSGNGVLGDGYLFQLMHLSIREYVPRDFDGHVVLLHSSRLDGKVGDDVAGWASVTSAEAWPIPGGHRTSVTKFVRDVAKRMRPYLEEVVEKEESVVQ